ncbi:hypothetical protein [Methylobacterium marchantiae]|uniref:hypothetical protein n=1 Tax=Methylobacterium marchantiae TaxID=600331 RepID=UPI001EDEF9A6
MNFALYNFRMDIRWFSDEARDCSAEWRATLVSADAWQQIGQAGAAGGEAEGFFVQCGSVEGYAKDSGGAFRAAHEKIASDLAFDLGLPVPPLVLWEDGAARRAVSRLPFTAAFKWDHARQAPSAVTRMMPALTQAASAMVAFDSWVENIDRINGGNMIVSLALPQGFGCAYIDYAFSLSHGWGCAPANPTSIRRGPYPEEVIVDGAILAETVFAIEKLPSTTIEEIVRRIPDAFMEEQRRENIVASLVTRRDQLRSSLGL